MTQVRDDVLPLYHGRSRNAPCSAACDDRSLCVGELSSGGERRTSLSTSLGAKPFAGLPAALLVSPAGCLACFSCGLVHRPSSVPRGPSTNLAQHLWLPTQQGKRRGKGRRSWATRRARSKQLLCFSLRNRQDYQHLLRAGSKLTAAIVNACFRRFSCESSWPARTHGLPCSRVVFVALVTERLLLPLFMPLNGL
eukprot:scaffold11_cov257-Pinguiococcus_pyrenoidosus.AAC.51